MPSQSRESFILDSEKALHVLKPKTRKQGRGRGGCSRKPRKLDYQLPQKASVPQHCERFVKYMFYHAYLEQVDSELNYRQIQVYSCT